MNTKQNKRTLVLVAASLLTTTVGLASSAAKAEGTCQIPDPETQPGGEVALPLARLMMAQQLPNGKWRVHVHASRVAGIAVPTGVEWVPVILTPQQRETAVAVANSANSKTAVFAVHSQAWVQEMEERLLGGFSVNFNVTVCDYSQPWS